MFLYLYLKEGKTFEKLRTRRQFIILSLLFLFILSEITDISTSVDLFSVKFVFYRNNNDEKLLSETCRLATI